MFSCTSFIMIRFVLSLFLQFYVVQVNSCECEVESWSEWITNGCGSASRSRVCSGNNGWTLGLTCNENDRHNVFESKVLPPCRKLLFTEISSLTFPPENGCLTILAWSAWVEWYNDGIMV